MDGLALQRLAYQYRPLLYLHTQEPYFPVDFAQYIDAAQLKRKSTGEVVHPEVPFSAAVFGQWLETQPELNSQDYTLFLPQGMNTPLIAQYRPTEAQLRQVPLYVNHRVVPPSADQPDTRVLLSYSHMYAYNGPEPVCCCLEVGEHYADIEHVTAELRVTARGDVTYERLYTSRHNGGVWVDAKDLLLWNGTDRPTVFSSCNGHASYTQPGNCRRFWGFAVDRCDYGVRWDPDRLVFRPASLAASPPDLKWAFFVGDMGDGHVIGWGGKYYLQDDEVNQEYGTSWWPGRWNV